MKAYPFFGLGVPTRKGSNLRPTILLALAVLIATTASAAGDAILFPKPLHLTREIVDPVSGRTAHVEQYCLANRVVAIAGSRTVIADYDRSELTEIDREHGTYSVTPFAAVASARPRRKVPARVSANAVATPAAGPVVANKGTDHRAGRNVDLVAADDAAHAIHAELALDQSATLSRDAFDVLAGAAYPNEGDASTDLLRSAARRAAGAATEAYGLPIEQVLRWEVNGKALTSTNRVTRLTDDVAPPDLLAIPPGARRVDSHIVVTARESEQLDALPGKARP